MTQSTPSVSGYFEITVNGELVHSKKGGENFPDEAKVAAIAAKIEALLQ
jgi:selT/selW/selH-like putative selenoprotein